MKPSNDKPEDLETPPLNSVKDKVQKMNNHCGFPHELSCLNTALQVTSGGRKMGFSALSYIGSEMDSENCQCVI